VENKFVCLFEVCDLEIETLKMDISREIHN